MSDLDYAKEVLKTCLDAQEIATLIIGRFPSFYGVSTIPEFDKPVIKEAVKRMISRLDEIKTDLPPHQAYLAGTIDLTVSQLNYALVLLNRAPSLNCLGIVIKINID